MRRAGHAPTPASVVIQNCGELRKRRWVACRHDAKRRVGMSDGSNTCRPPAAPSDGMPPRNPHQRGSLRQDLPAGVSEFAGGATLDGKVLALSPSCQAPAGRSASDDPNATRVCEIAPAIFARPFQARKLFKMLKLHTLPKRLQLPNGSSLLSPIWLSGQQRPRPQHLSQFIPGLAGHRLCAVNRQEWSHLSRSLWAPPIRRSPSQAWLACRRVGQAAQSIRRF
jgi:hypothetical protein